MRMIPYITKYKVIMPTNEMETKGEILYLSTHGEYCPKSSLRGYNLEYLMSNPNNYLPLEHSFAVIDDETP